MSYDIWLTTAPADLGGSGYPLMCTECGEHEFTDTEDKFQSPHCVDEDDGTVNGILVYDESYDFAYDDPRIP